MRAPLLPAFLAVSGVPAAWAQAPATAFVNVSVIPMDREQVLAGQTVVVERDRIVTLGPTGKVSVPAGAVQIDGRGKFLIPGLADMHAHLPGITALMRKMTTVGGDRLRQLTEPAYTADEMAEAERMLSLYVATGVTTIRVMHGAPEMLALRARAAKGELFSPRIYVATPMLRDGSGPVVSTFAGVGSPEEAVHIVEVAKTMGYDIVKLYGIAGERLDSLVVTARRLGMPIAGHVPDGDNGIQEAIRTRYTSIEHLSGFGEYLMGRGDSALQSSAGAIVDTVKLHTLAASLREAGVWNCPTLMLLGKNAQYFSVDSILQWPEMRYYKAAVHEELEAKHQAPSEESSRLALQEMNAYRLFVRVLKEEGVGLLLGADAGTPGILSGFSIHRELQELVRAGLTPYEALATGTRNVAAYFGTLDSTGTVAVGKRADLVLLSGNPLQDIRHTALPAGVMAGGRWFSRQDLDARLKAVEGTLDF